ALVDGEDRTRRRRDLADRDACRQRLPRERRAAVVLERSEARVTSAVDVRRSCEGTGGVAADVEAGRRCGSGDRAVATATRGGSNDGCERVQVRAARDVRPARGFVVRDGGVPDVDVMVFGCHAATAGGSGVLDNCGVVDAQLAILDVNGAAAAAGGVAR